MSIAGPVGYKQCAVVASQPGIGEPGSNSANLSKSKKLSPTDLFS